MLNYHGNFPITYEFQLLPPITPVQVPVNVSTSYWIGVMIIMLNYHGNFPKYYDLLLHPPFIVKAKVIKKMKKKVRI